MIYVFFIAIHFCYVPRITSFWVHYYLLKNGIIVSDEIKQQNMKRKDILFELVASIIIVIILSIVLMISELDMNHKFTVIIVVIIIIIITGFIVKKQRLVSIFYGMSGTIIKFESKILSFIFCPLSSRLSLFYFVIPLLLIMILVFSNLKK